MAEETNTQTQTQQQGSQQAVKAKFWSNPNGVIGALTWATLMM